MSFSTARHFASYASGSLLRSKDNLRGVRKDWTNYYTFLLLPLFSLTYNTINTYFF